MEQREYLLIKLGRQYLYDFYNEHIALIKQYGYVDLAVFTSRRPVVSRYERTMYIKEADNNGGRLFGANIMCQLDSGEIFPEYYKEIQHKRVVWIRISALYEVNIQSIDNDYTTKTGKSIISVLKASTPYFGMIKKQEA